MGLTAVGIAESKNQEYGLSNGFIRDIGNGKNESNAMFIILPKNCLGEFSVFGFANPFIKKLI